LYAPPAQSLAVQLGYSFTPPQSPPVELELLEELELLLEELELELLEELEMLEELEELEELELLLDELELELLDELELLELEELELLSPPKVTSIQLKKRS